DQRQLGEPLAARDFAAEQHLAHPHERSSGLRGDVGADAGYGRGTTHGGHPIANRQELCTSSVEAPMSLAATFFVLALVPQSPTDGNARVKRPPPPITQTAPATAEFLKR